MTNPITPEGEKLEIVDIANMPNHNPNTASRGEHSVSEGQVYAHPTQRVVCKDHGAMLCVNPDRTIYRCEACGAGAYVASRGITESEKPRSAESTDATPNPDIEVLKDDLLSMVVSPGTYGEIADNLADYVAKREREALERLKGHDGACTGACDRVPHQEINDRISELQGEE